MPKSKIRRAVQKERKKQRTRELKKAKEESGPEGLREYAIGPKEK